MALDPSPAPVPTVRSRPGDRLRPLIAGIIALGMVSVVWQFTLFSRRSSFSPSWDKDLAPLVMQGGDPYIRALMRTISASESNSSQPYSILYGGDHFQDLSQHPDRCVPIVTGVNEGDCTTAAGRYQFITSTWEEKAAFYHPQPSNFFFWHRYSFEPEYQDQVVYRWLNDPQAWGVDIAALLREGRIQEVLQILSPTWTSLGDGIESNDMTELLPQIYQQLLQQELGNQK